MLRLAPRTTTTTTDTRPLTQALAWAGDGAAHLRGLMARMGEDAFPAPSALPGWSRAHLLTHVARSADALINLLTWARTGVRSPAYTSREQRDADIEAGARRSPAEICDDVVATSDRLAKVVRSLPEAAWDAHVEHPPGRGLPAAHIPWLRAREVWVHAVDLDVGASFADLPAPMLTQLLGDAAATMGQKPECPPLRLVTPDGLTWEVGDQVAATTITGPAPSLAAWLLGRATGREVRTADGARPPALPRWL